MLETLLQNRTVQVLIDSFPRILVPGLAVTIPLTVLSFAFAMVIAAAVALVQYARVPVLRQLARVYIWVVRGTPLLVQLFIIFYGLPSMGIVLDAFPTAVIAFSIHEGAYCAETIRAPLESGPARPLEAGHCGGGSRGRRGWAWRWAGGPPAPGAMRRTRAAGRRSARSRSATRRGTWPGRRLCLL